MACRLLAGGVFKRSLLAVGLVLTLLPTTTSNVWSDNVEQTLRPEDPALDWRLETVQSKDCAVCDAIVAIALEQKSQHPNQCSLIEHLPAPGFELPEWRQINYLQNAELLKGAIIATQSSNARGLGFVKKQMPDASLADLQAAFWNQFSKPILALFADGKAGLEAASFDMNGDGLGDLIYRITHVEPVNSNYVGPWTIQTCDLEKQVPAYFTFASDPSLDRFLRRYAREYNTLFRYRGDPYLWHRASSGGYVLSITRSDKGYRATQVFSSAYWYRRSN